MAGMASEGLRPSVSIRVGCVLLILFAFPARAGMGPVSTIRGQVMSFDERKVRLKVGNSAIFVARDTIDERSLKLGAQVDSVSPSSELFPDRKTR
jgi:hypothetical protein